MISDLLKGKNKENIINAFKNKDIILLFSYAISRDKEFIIEYIKNYRMKDVNDYLNGDNGNNYYYKIKILSKLGYLNLFKNEFEKIYINSEEFEDSFEIVLNSTIDYFNQAIRFKNYEIINYLLNYELVGEFLINEHPWLNLAAEYGDIKLVKILFEYYKDSDRKIYEATYNAYKFNKKDILNFLLPYAKLSEEEEKKYRSIL